MQDELTTERLIQRIAEGDRSAVEALFDQHRQRLWRMVSFRLDPCVSARIDASDVVQDAMVEAVKKLPEYLRQRPVAFYPWLRRIAWQHIVHLHEKHLYRQRRSVFREQHGAASRSDPSRVELVRQLAVAAAGPSTMMGREEQLMRVQQAIDRLSSNHREVLVLRYVELLTVSEMAAVLNISEAAVKMRHIRAIERLREQLLQGDAPEES